MVLKNENLNFYLEYEQFFIEDLGFKPLRQAPDMIVRRKKNTLEKELPKYKRKSYWLTENGDTTLYLSTAAKQIALTKVIITRECLLSFFSEEIRSNPVIHAFVYRRLLFGKKPLNSAQKKALDRYYETVVSSLGKESSTRDLLHKNYTAIEIYMRKDRIEESFRKYVHGLANFDEFLSEDNFELTDAILTDIWLRLFMTVPFNVDEFYLFFEMVKLFYKLGKLYSLKVLKEYIRGISIPELKDKDMLNLIVEWQKNLSKLEKAYFSLSNRSVAFIYRLNWGSIGISIIYFVLRFNKNIKREIIDFAFKNMTGLIRSQERRFDNSIIKYGQITCRIQDYDILNEFFESLKSNNIIDEYVFFKRTHLSFNFNVRNKKENKTPHYKGVLVDYEKTKKIMKLDTIDFILIWSLRTNYVGLRVGLDRTDYFIEQIKKELRTCETQKRSQSINLKKMTEIKVSIQDIKLLIPLDFRRKENIDKIQLKYLMELFSKKFTVLTIKFIYDNLFKIYSVFYEIFREPEKKISDFTNIKEFLDQNILNKKDPESNIFLKRSFSSLEHFFAETDHLLNFRGWILNNFLYFEKNLEKFSEIINNLQNICDYLEIINSPFTKRNISLKIETMTSYLGQSRDEIHLDLEKRIQKMKDENLIIPNILNSIAIPNLYFEKTLLLKNIEMGDKRIQVISKQFPYVLVTFSQNSNPKYVLIDIRAHSDLNKTVYNTIRRLFKENIVFFTTLQGEIYDTFTDYSNFYNFRMKSFDSLKSNFDSIKDFLNIYKKNNVDFPNKIFNVSNNNKTVFNLDKNKDCIYDSDKSKFKLVLIENYLKNDEKNQRLAKTIHDTEKDLMIPFDIFIKNETKIKYSALKNNGFPNFGCFNLSFYLIQASISKKSFSVKDSVERITNKFLLTPGFSEIKISADLGVFQQTFIKYITPREDPPVKIFNYALRRKIISKFRVMRILKMHVNFNHVYFFDEIWTPYFGVWDNIAKKIASNPRYQFDPEFKTFDFTSTKDKTYGKESIEFETAVKSFENSLRMKYTGNIKDMIDSGIISAVPDFNLNKLQLNEKIIIFFGQINEDQKRKIMMIFSMLPQVKIYDIDYFESNDAKVHHFGLLLELNLPNSRLDQLYFSINDLTILLDIKEFEFTPGVINLTPQEFTDGKIKKRPHPLQSHLWSKQTKTWKKVKYFDKNGVPLKYQERIDQLEK